MQLRGAYFTTGQGDTSIDFYILDENRRVVLNQRKKTEGIFSFNATKPGHYMFVYSNLKVSVNPTILFGNRAVRPSA
jgi:hypothetical protein